MKLLHFKINI